MGRVKSSSGAAPSHRSAQAIESGRMILYDEHDNYDPRHEEDEIERMG